MSDLYNDAFSLLGVDPTVAMDLKAVAERHRKLSGTLHPDRYSGRPASERRMALDKAIRVNEAWRELRNPIKRSEAVLRRLGIDVSETNQPKPNTALLMDMMEVREQLAVIRKKADLDALSKLIKTFGLRENELLTKLNEATDPLLSLDGPSEPLPADKQGELLALVAELRYVRRFATELEAAEEDLLES